MWGHTYVESDDAVVLCMISLCFAMYHMDFTDVVVSCMSQCHFLNALNQGCVSMVSYVHIKRIV